MASAPEHETSIPEHETRAASDAPAPRSIEAVLADPTTSYWLKTAIRTLIDRDPVDALNDALVLAALLDERLRSVLGVEDPPAEASDEEESDEEG